MSISDAILLEGLRLDVWIALRTDGVKGSGTEDDPYTGAVRSKPVLTGITIDRVGTEATVTANNHGYANGNIVVIDGATGADGALYNGTFSIYGVTQNTFKYLMNGTPGASASGSPTCTLDPYEFDAVMRSLPANVTVHLGPGIFETKGFSFSSASWQPKSGQKIIGSGIDITVLKIVKASTADFHYTAIGNFYYDSYWSLEGFEASDFTVDCNLSGQPIPSGKDFAPVACGAISVGGRHIRLRRIRAINFGTQAIPECFVITTGWAHPDVSEIANCVIEDCIVERPSLNNTQLTTLIGIGSFEKSTDGVYSFHRACVIRNCLIDAEYVNDPVGRVSSHLVGISSVTKTGTGPYTVRIVTATPHFRALGNNVVVSYVTVTSGSNGFNGAFTISNIVDPVTLEYVVATDPGEPAAQQPSAIIGVAIHGPGADGGTAAVVEGNRVYNCRLGNYADTWSTGDSIVRNNHFRNVGTGPYRQLGVLLGFGVSSTSDLITLVSLTNTGSTATATTSRAHGFSVNDHVIIGEATGADANLYNNPVNGLITAVTSSTTFQYQMTGAPSGPAQGSPGYATADPDNFRQRLLASLTYALENGVYVASAQTSYAAHGFAVGDAVKISKATGQLDQAHNDLFNGYHTITNVPNANTFKYALVDNPNPPNQSGSSPSGYFGRLWQTGRLVIENNVIELIASPTSADTPAGILLGYTDFTSPPLYRQVVLRNNVIRHVDGASEPQAVGISVSGCGDLIVEDNVVDLDHPTPIRYSYCDKVRFFNNQTSAGTLIQGVDVTSPSNPIKTSELTTDIEDAYVLAI